VNEIPSPREELERKTVEALDELAHRLHNSRLTKEEFGFAAKLLWKVTAGLVDSSISDLCEAASAHAKASVMKQSFFSPNRIVIFLWSADKDDYVMRVRDYVGPKDLMSKVVRCSFDERHERLQKAFTALETQGGYIKA
jgi:hypothetical protein